MTSAPQPLPALADDRMEWLARMLLIRRFEEVAEDMSLRGKIPAGIHPSIGQEAIAVGAMAALDPADPIAGTHRSHHHALARGTSPDLLMAELFAKAAGLQGGRGGSMHVGDLSLANLGGNGIVGAGVGIAMGTALGIKLSGHDRAAVGFVGDGGANTGRTWEFVNLAVIWSLPLIVIVENNLYAVETRIDRMLGGGSITRRAEGFGIATKLVDGQDAEAVWAAVSDARKRAVSGGGPTLLEAQTYRYRGHGSGERANYRTAEEIEQWRSSRDPIDRLAAALVDRGVLDPQTIETMRLAAQSAVAAAVTFAEESPVPDPATLTDGVDLWPSYEGILP